MEIRSIGPFLKYFGSVRERTMRVARCVPPEKVDWSYAAGKFSVGDLLRHIAVTERFLFAENIQGRASCYTRHDRELAGSLEEILAFMERLHAESLSIFGALSDEDLQRKCPTVGGAEVPIPVYLRSMIEHEVHHRGEIYVYLGMLGLSTPPLYGLTSEEVRAKGMES